MHWESSRRLSWPYSCLQPLLFNPSLRVLSHMLTASIIQGPSVFQKGARGATSLRLEWGSSVVPSDRTERNQKPFLETRCCGTKMQMTKQLLVSFGGHLPKIGKVCRIVPKKGLNFAEKFHNRYFGVKSCELVTRSACTFMQWLLITLWLSYFAKLSEALGLLGLTLLVEPFLYWIVS